MKLKRNQSRSKNYYAIWTDEHGIQRQRTTGTSVRKLAHEIGSKWEADALRIREGLVDPAQLAQRDAARLPVSTHLDDYLAWCRSRGDDAAGLRTKETQIRAYLKEQQIASLRDVTPATLVRFMAGIVRRGRAPRTANLHRGNVVAFMNWCKDYRRITSHDLTKRTVPKLDEAQDQRRKRRALTPEELDRLRAATLPSGRWWVYQLAIWTGLRRGELGKIRWSDIDLERGELHVRAEISKNGKEATLPLLDAALESLEALRHLGPESDLVVLRVPAKETVYADLERAGIQGRTATGSCATNAAGERVDFHALRTTCGTMLANAGVPVMHLKRMMRHANIAMTDRHYTKLRTTDLRAGLERALEKPVALAATGTETLTPKLTPTTATNGVFRGATASNGPTRIGAARRAASGLRSGVYALPGASKDDGVQHPSNYGPVAQRPTANRADQRETLRFPADSPPNSPPSCTPATASDPALELLVAALTPAQLRRLRTMLEAG